MFEISFRVHRDENDFQEFAPIDVSDLNQPGELDRYIKHWRAELREMGYDL